MSWHWDGTEGYLNKLQRLYLEEDHQSHLWLRRRHGLFLTFLFALTISHKDEHAIFITIFESFRIFRDKPLTLSNNRLAEEPIVCIINQAINQTGWQWLTVKLVPITSCDIMRIQVVQVREHNRQYFVNSLAPGRFQFNLRKVIFKATLVNGGWGIFHEIALRWMPLDFTLW